MVNKDNCMEIARQTVAQGWCDTTTSHLEMDVVLVEAIAKAVMGWIVLAAEMNDAKDYYRNMLVEIGEACGKEAYIQDDGGIVDEVLVAKVPELVISKLCKCN
jgi:hypothetical protein